MTDTGQAEPPAAPDVSRETPGTDGTVAERLDQQDRKLDRLADMVSRLVPGSHGEAQQRTADRLDRPSTIEEQVRAELKRATEEQAAAAARDKSKADQQAEQQTLAQRLKSLEERAPAPPVPRRTKLLGWGG